MSEDDFIKRRSEQVGESVWTKIRAVESDKFQGVLNKLSQYLAEAKNRGKILSSEDISYFLTAQGFGDLEQEKIYFELMKLAENNTTKDEK